VEHCLYNPNSIEEADENLFNSIRYNPSHLLHQLLPIDELNPVTACDTDPTTLNSPIGLSTMTEILLTACFFIHTTTRNELS